MIQDPATDREAQIQRRIAELKREDLIQQRIEELKRGQAAPVETADWESVYGAPTATAEAPPAAPEVTSGALSRFGRGAAESLLGAPGQAVEGLGVLTGSEGMQEAGKAIQPEFLDPAERDTTAAKLGSVAGSGAAFMIPGGAAGFGAKALGATGKALTLARAGTVATQATLQAMPDAFYSAKANGASDQKAWWSALVSSGGQGLLELGGPQGHLLDKLVDGVSFADKATGGMGKALLHSTLQEAGEEAAQQLYGDVVAQRLFDTAPDEDWATILGNAAKAAPYGAFGGALLGSAALGAAKIQQEINRPPGIPQTEPDRTPPVYDPIERDLTPEEESALEKWKADRGASRVDVVERPDMTEATELARKAGLDVLFVDDDGKGAKEGVTFDRRTALVPANADPATVGLAIATHEGVHGMPKSAREALRASLAGAEATKGPLEQAGKNYADRAEKEGVKLSKADLEEEATADLVAALAPVAQRVMRNPARAVALMNDKPGVMVKVLDFARKWAGKTTHAEMVAKELESLAEVQSALAKGMTGRQRVQAAGKIVEAFSKIDVAMKQPVKVKAKPKAETGMVPVGEVRDNLASGVQEKGAKSAAVNAEVARENETYRPSPITLGESQRFDSVSDEDLRARRDKAAEDQAYETDLALREAGFSDFDRAKYRKARNRAVVAQRALDMARNDAQASEARQEVQDAARRLKRYEDKLTPAQRERLRSTEDPEVYDRVLAAREAKAKGRFGSERALERAVPSTRYSLASDAGAQGEDVEAARKAWKEQGTDSPWFKRWFGASKVVDGEGKPLVVYHGTTETDVGVMRPSFEAGLGIFFSDNDNVSETFRVPREYGEPVYQDEDGNDIEPGDLVSAYLKIENPFVVEDSNAQRFVDDTGYQVQVLKKARADGHDGVIVRNVLEGIGERYESTNYVVFNSTQIKSTGNRGTFSPANPDIRYSLKSDIESVAADLSEPEGYQPAVASEEMPSRMVAKYVRAMNPVERKGVEEMMSEADAILADRGAREKLARRAMNHEALNEGEQIALQRIASLKATNAWRQGASMDNAVEAQFAFQQARTTAGRVLGNPALRDALQSPAERAMGLALSPSKQVAKAYKKAKTWQARRAIVEEEARKIERIRYSLAQKGFDPSLIPDDYFKDPTFRNVWAESVADAKAGSKWDWYIQYRRAAMLSGPITTIRNVTGNTSYVTYDRIARIWADAIIPGTGTSVEDARAYTRDIFAGIAQGWKDARAAYSAFYDASTEGTSLDEHATFRRGPVMVGLEAVGVRAQAAQDIFFRSVVGAAETRLRARQKARAEGGSAEDYLSDPDVLAMSKEDMERALFLDRDALTRSITGARDWLDEKARFPVGTTIVPFAATPTKIVQRGGETLLGPLGGYMRDREKWGGVLLGAGAWAAMVWAASMFDDDDGLPLITGSRARGGQGDFQDRTAPAYSIRIGDEYYSYQQIEPLSTALAAIADAVQSEDPMKSVSSFAAAAKDKSFFRSIETVYDAIVGAANGERGSDRAKQVARDLLWTPMIPNIIRSPVRAADDTRRKELGNPLEAEDFLNAAVPTGDFGPPLRYDLWGRPAEKAGGSWVSRVLAPAMGTKDVEDVEKIDLLLADYNRKSDEDKFFSAPAVFVTRNGERRDWTEEEYSELIRDAGAQALTILRPWAANKTELTERDLKHIGDVLSKTRARKVEELLRR